MSHYSAEARGQAFGPLALDQTLAFCRLLEHALSQNGKVAVATRAGDTAERANAAVLLGAFLILRRQWAAGQVAQAMSTEGPTIFPCSWTRPRSSEHASQSSMSVKDCWEGVQLAHGLGWITSADDFSSSFLCSQYRRTLEEYDAAWLAPGRLLVAADPMTVIRDPNPLTCCKLLPDPGRPGWLSPCSSQERESFASVSFDARTEQHLEAELLGTSAGWRGPSTWLAPAAGDKGEGTGGPSGAGEPMCKATPEGCRDSEGKPASSCDTVCKEYVIHHDGSNIDSYPPQDFVTWCRSHNVKQIVRANFGDEPGLKEIGGSYDKGPLEQHGIRVLDAPTRDYGGGVPDAYALRDVLDLCDGMDQQSAMLVHCKGGFGRSMLLACCCLIHERDVPGRALMAWARIARPGAITTPEQEHFLCRFENAADLERYIHQHTYRCSLALWRSIFT